MFVGSSSIGNHVQDRSVISYLGWPNLETKDYISFLNGSEKVEEEENIVL